MNANDARTDSKERLVSKQSRNYKANVSSREIFETPNASKDVISELRQEMTVRTAERIENT